MDSDERVLRIDCGECELEGTTWCTDCVVTYLCDRDGTAVIVDLAEVRALQVIAGEGLAPTLRHRRRASSGSQ
jgi:hypothetical protein